MREDLGALSSDITTWVFWQQSKGGMRKEQRSKEICQRLEDSCVSRLTLCTKAFMTFPQLTATAFKYVSNILKQIRKTCIYMHMNKLAERANKQATKSLNKSSPWHSPSQEARELQPPHKLF